MLPDTFRLGGSVYSRRWRRCGKSNCRSCANCAGHGPYWYKQGSDGLRYIGRELSPSVEQAYSDFLVHQQAAVARKSELVEILDAARFQIGAVDAFLSGAYLSQKQIVWLVSAGLMDRIL